MIDSFPNPWDFGNTDKKLISVDNQHKVTYYDLNEIAMGAPLCGNCYIESKHGKKIKIDNWCGGPPVWETSGQLVAIPIWKRKFWKGTIQQIGILDIKTMELKLFSKKFFVLDFRSFHKNMIYGYDSPSHNTKTVTFDTEKEKVETIIKLM